MIKVVVVDDSAFMRKAISTMLAKDPEPEVRAIVAERALPGLAATLLQDEEWWVRLAAVSNAPLEFLAALAADPEIEVREAALARLSENNA